MSWKTKHLRSLYKSIYMYMYKDWTGYLMKKSILQGHSNSSMGLTLIGMGMATFIPLYFLDWMLELFWGENWHQLGWFNTLTSLLNPLEMSLGSAKDNPFSCFHNSCQLGLSLFKRGKDQLLAYLSTYSHPWYLPI